MDNEILVKEFREITKIFEQEKGAVSLLMLKAFNAEMNDYWNLIVSTPALANQIFYHNSEYSECKTTNNQAKEQFL